MFRKFVGPFRIVFVFVNLEHSFVWESNRFLTSPWEKIYVLHDLPRRLSRHHIPRFGFSPLSPSCRFSLGIKACTVCLVAPARKRNFILLYFSSSGTSIFTSGFRFFTQFNVCNVRCSNSGLMPTTKTVKSKSSSPNYPRFFYLIINLIRCKSCRYYYQYEESRLSASPTVLHGLLHIPQNIRQCGPVWTTCILSVYVSHSQITSSL